MTVVTELDVGDRQVITLGEGAERDRAFAQVCQLNPDARIEQSAEGEIIIMAPTGGESGYQSSETNRQLANWANADGAGKAFDAGTGFELPNGAKRSPDASWVRLEKILALPKALRKTYLPLTPDFAIEVLSPSDRLKETQEKCREYISNGTAEAWLIDPEHRTVWLYSQAEPQGRESKDLDAIASKSLPGFALDLRSIWQGLDL
jgi:Uma2 family endonuclease